MSLLNLPEEVHDEIFLKLPGNSILSSRCVCKLFYNLLSKPSFIKNHLDRTIKRKSSPKLLFSTSYSSRDDSPMIYSIPIDYASLSSSIEYSEEFLLSCECDGAFLINYPFESKNLYFLEFLGSCNGLICSRIRSTDRADFQRGYFVETCYFSILNPLTKEFKEFMDPRYGCGEPKNCSYSVAYGFGYDSNIDDYKLVRISDYENAGCRKVDVYTVKSDSWNSIQGIVDYSFPCGRTPCVSFNGALHCLGTTSAQETLSEVIISFDITSETIVGMSLPENSTSPQDDVGGVYNYKDLGVWGDCICVAFIWRLVRIDVWVMHEYGVKESWTKRFTTTEQPCTKHPFWKPLWCYDDGEILVDNNNHKQLLIYDPTTEKIRSVVILDNRLMGINRESYVESLISLDSGTYLEKPITDGIVNNPW